MYWESENQLDFWEWNHSLGDSDPFQLNRSNMTPPLDHVPNFIYPGKMPHLRPILDFLKLSMCPILCVTANSIPYGQHYYQQPPGFGTVEQSANFAQFTPNGNGFTPLNVPNLCLNPIGPSTSPLALESTPPTPDSVSTECGSSEGGNTVASPFSQSQSEDHQVFDFNRANEIIDEYGSVKDEDEEAGQVIEGHQDSKGK